MGEGIWYQLGNQESVLATVKARYGQVQAAIQEIRSVIEDCRAAANIKAEMEKVGKCCNF